MNFVFFFTFICVTLNKTQQTKANGKQHWELETTFQIFFKKSKFPLLHYLHHPLKWNRRAKSHHSTILANWRKQLKPVWFHYPSITIFTQVKYTLRGLELSPASSCPPFWLHFPFWTTTWLPKCLASQSWQQNQEKKKKRIK